jgi:hypothetical protein
MTCTCGLGHRGWEKNLCRIELFKRAEAAKQVVTTAPVPKIKTILDVSNATVSVKKHKNKPVTTNKEVTTNAERQTVLRKKRAAQGLIQWTLWSHPDDMAAIKKLAKELDGNRSKVS